MYIKQTPTPSLAQRAHVEAAAVGHAHLQAPDAARCAALDQRLQARQQRLAALDAEPLQCRCVG